MPSGYGPSTMLGTGRTVARKRGGNHMCSVALNSREETGKPPPLLGASGNSRVWWRDPLIPAVLSPRRVTLGKSRVDISAMS